MGPKKLFGLALAIGMAFAAVTASTGSATTLEVNGVPQNKSVAFTATAKSGTSLTLRQTDASFIDTCTTSEMKGATEGTFTGASVGGKVSTLSLGSCTHTTDVIKAGRFSVSRIGSTTNGTLFVSDMEITVTSTTFGVSLLCKAGEGTDFGTITGVASGNSTVHIKAILGCGFFVPTAVFEGTHTVTSPTGTGVTG